MLICSPSGCGKTNLLPDVLFRVLHCEKINLYTKNLEQSQLQNLIKTFDSISKEVGYPVIEASNDKILPLSEFYNYNQKACYLNTGLKNDS